MLPNKEKGGRTIIERVTIETENMAKIIFNWHYIYLHYTEEAAGGTTRSLLPVHKREELS